MIPELFFSHNDNLSTKKNTYFLVDTCNCFSLCVVIGALMFQILQHCAAAAKQKTRKQKQSLTPFLPPKGIYNWHILSVHYSLCI